jgi:cytochrome c oxidase subunit 3
MANSQDNSNYYVPHSSWYPVAIAAAIFCLVVGLGNGLNDVKGGEGFSLVMPLLGLAGIFLVLYYWYGTVISENESGIVNGQLKKSYVWGMGWFIFSEVMFFAAFFGALFYARVLAVAWLGGEGGKGITGQYLWPEFSSAWPVVANPDPALFPGPQESMAAPAISNLSAWAKYLPFWNTAILLTSSVTVHMAHTAIKNSNRGAIKAWLGVTVLLGIVFLFLQVEEYIHAYNELGLTLESGIYGSTFFILTGFHGFHVTLGTLILAISLYRVFRGHFNHEDCFGFEAASWYWHFVDVVWVCLFFFVYIF